MSDPYENYEQRAPHEDSAVQALIDNGRLGTWDGPITVADLEIAVGIHS